MEKLYQIFKNEICFDSLSATVWFIDLFPIPVHLGPCKFFSKQKGVCISYLSVAMTKYCHQKPLEEKGLILSYGPRGCESVIAGKPWPSHREMVSCL